MKDILPLSTLPFSPKEYVAGTETTYDNLLGQLFYDGASGITYMLVQLSETSGANVKKKCMKWVSRSAHTVARCTAYTDRVAGVGPSTMDVATTPDDSYFLLAVGGRVTVTHGDDHSSNGLSSTLKLAMPDDDADKGKIRGSRLPQPGRHVFGEYVSGTAADDADMVVELNLDEDAARAPLFGLKSGTFAGRNGAGAITLTGAAVGERVVLVQVYGDVSDNLTRTVDGTVTAGGQAAALFETVITVADQIQQASATDLSDNKYLVILAPAAN